MTFPVVGASGPSGWEVAAAVGTIGGAAATLLAVVAALVVGARDRRAADRALQQQLDAQRDARAREHHLDLLLELQSLLAITIVYRGGPQSREAELKMVGLLLALPDAGPLPALRHFAGRHLAAFDGMATVLDVYGDEEQLTEWARAELATQIRRVAAA